MLTDVQREELAGLVRAGRTAQRLVLRARIVLLAAAGASNTAIAATVACCVDTVRKWRHRWAASPGTASLGDAKRSGRPPRFTPVQVAQVKALACTPPAQASVPISRWSCPELARQAVTGGICASLSAPTVRRWLSEDAIKPWQHRSWIFIRDPNFAAKAARVLDLYARTWDGMPLGADEYVISADEKTSIQARCRCHPSLPPGRSRMMRINHDYDRGGALAYLAAYDVHRGQVFGRCEDTTGIVPFTALVDQVMVHTPVHASWLNQVEIFFSIIQRKVVSPNDFTDLTMIEERLADFEVHYNATAGPFKWKFTTADLTELLTRLDQRPTQTGPAHAA
ncbi:MAG TPA: IS630 family transposase [Segeticoccus sp.]|nr:IS630 family transposase [Segeticoccus sp.]